MAITDQVRREVELADGVVEYRPQVFVGEPLRQEFKPAHERVMVCVSGGGLIARVIRAGLQMSVSLQARWVAVYVETPEYHRLSARGRENIARALNMAEQLGAETVILPGQEVARELLRYAQANGITKIVVGKPYRRRWQEVLRASLADELVRGSSSITVFIVNTARERPASLLLSPDASSRVLRGYLLSLLVIAGATALGFAVQPYLDPVNIALIYFIAVVFSATTWGLGPSIACSVAAVILLDDLFIPPYGLISIDGVRDLVTLVFFLVVAVVVSELGARVRAQVESARAREEQAAALYALSRDMAFAADRTAILTAASEQIRNVFDAEPVILLPDTEGKLQSERWGEFEELDGQAAHWAFEHGEAAGNGTALFSSSALLFLPLHTAQGAFGVLGLEPHGPGYLTPDRRRLLETFAGQIAIALEHSKLSVQAEQARLLEANENFRNALLSSISHDLRTPLASILGSATTLLDEGAQFDSDARIDLLATIREEATRLNRIVGNLLDMTRLQAGVLSPRFDWHSLEEVIGAALAHLGTNANNVHLDIEPDLPFVSFDFVLIEQVLLNLLDNAFKFSPPDSAVEIRVRRMKAQIYVSVADYGRGIPVSELDLVFDKFYRGRDSGRVPGTGLGLSICRGIIEAHGGTIWAEKREAAGTCITFALPGFSVELGNER